MNKISLLTAVLLSFASFLMAQISDGTMPVSFEYPMFGNSLPIVVAPELDMDKVRREDQAHAEKGELYTIGRILPVKINPKTSGEWQSLRNGDRVWRVRIQSKGAQGLSLYFSEFNLPKGARMHVYSADRQHVIGGFTYINNHASGLMATSHVYSDDIIVEYYEPVFAQGQGRFVIEEVGHGYKDVRDFGDSGSCEVNVNCPEGAGRTNQRNAVARILVRVGANQGWCSGTLINNVRQDCTPYFITAWHCGEGGSVSDFNQWVFYFNYQAAGCTNPASQPTIQSLTGAVRRADSNDGGGATGSDLLLLELNATPPANYNVYYVGWDRNNTATTGGYSIHHPAGDIKKISTFTNTTSSTSWGGSVANTHWGTNWVATTSGHGVTEGGSSGSAMFNSAGRLIGTLTGGGSSCSNRTAADAYGKFSYHWNSNGTIAARRVRDWLDPDNTGVLTLDGIAAPCAVGVDAGVATIINPPNGQNICANPIAPSVTLQNFGGTTITSAIIRYRINTGAVNNFNWSGSLASGGTTTVTLPSTTFPIGATFTFAAWTASPNGTTDANIANDTARAVSLYENPTALPYLEAFNAGALPTNLDILDPNADNFVWAYEAGISAYGTGTGSIKYDNYNGTAGANPAGTLDWFILPTLDFSSQTNPQITFDVAYGQYGAANSDTLIVAFSTACSPNYSIVYLEGGSVLATRPGAVTAAFVPTAAEWVNKTVTLPAALVAGQSHVSIAFINKSGWGNHIYVDNINILGACAISTTTSSQTNIACFGGSNGAFTVTATGGTMPYTFNRGTGAQSTGAFTGVAAGTYNVTVTDANSCTAVRTVTITQPSAALAATTSSQTNIACFGSATGAFTISATGGTAPYTYNRGTGAQTNATFTAVAAGTYNVTITDANSCTTVRTVTITQPASALAATTSSQNNLTCLNSGNGSFTIAAAGGTAPYMFNRGTGAQSTGAFTGVAAGTYNVTVTDANSCTVVRTVTITQPSAALAATTSSQTNIACFGGSNGAFTVAATGGTTPYTFNRGTGAQSTGAFTSVAAGTYNVTVSDAGGCTTVQTVIITQPSAALAATTSSQTNITCFGGSGAFTVAATGGTAPYTYNRGIGAQTNATFTAVAAGTYNVTITDANSCTTVRTVTITQPASALAATTSSQNNLTCLNSGNGSFTIAAAGGTAPYMFNRGTGAQSTGAFTGVAAGTYNVTVTDANSCTAVRTVTITQPSAALAATTSSQTNIACFGGSNGAFTVAATGGTTPYTFNRGTGAQSTGVFTGVAAGTYNVTVTDANSCTAVRTVTITQPSAALAATTSSQTNIACFGGNGAFTVTATGGTTPYTFNRGTGAQSTGAFTGVAAGTYNVTVTDANSCTAVRTVTITQPSAALTTTVSSQTNLTCLNSGNGSFTIAATGGTSPYMFNRGTGNQSSGSFSSLAAGTYNVTVTDGNGCTVVRTVTLTEPTAGISTTISTQTNVACFGGNGAFTVTATGGTMPYTFNRGTGAQSTGVFTGLSAGTYNVTVSDAGGCSTVQTVVISQPTSALASTTSSQTNIACFGGSNGAFTVTATGGTTPYTFNRGTGAQSTGAFTGVAAGTYNVTVTDANSCNTVQTVIITQPTAALAATTSSQTNIACFGNSTGAFSVVANGGTAPYTFNRGTGAQSVGNFTGVAAGTYTVTVTDANNCITTVSATINQPAAALAATVSAQTNVACFGTATGAFTMTATGGTANYSFNRGTGVQASGTFSGLNAGTYTVTISDANGCSTSQTATLSAPTSAVSAAISTTSTTCAGNDGTAIATPTGGVAPYTYRWSNNATTNSLLALGVGSVSVTITDNNGCAATASGFVANGCTVSCNVTVTGTSTNVNCFAACNGSITATTLGATAPVSFSWSNTNTGATINALCANTYSVTATDAAGCIATNSFAITQPATAVTATAVNNSQATTTEASVTASGGVAPYAVLWSNGATTTTISNLAAGDYTATVTDANGCAAVSNTVTIVISALTVANNDTEFSVYPNPNTGAFNIDIRQSGAQDIQIRVIDVLGRELRSVNVAAQAQILLPVDLSEQASGVYFVVLQAGEQTITRKVVLTRD